MSALAGCTVAGLATQLFLVAPALSDADLLRLMCLGPADCLVNVETYNNLSDCEVMNLKVQKVRLRVGVRGIPRQGCFAEPYNQQVELDRFHAQIVADYASDQIAPGPPTGLKVTP